MAETFKVAGLGLGYVANGEERYATQGEVISDAPLHGTGRCAADCAKGGAHDWLLDGVLERVPAEPPPVSLSKKGGPA